MGQELSALPRVFRPVQEEHADAPVLSEEPWGAAASEEQQPKSYASRTGRFVHAAARHDRNDSGYESSGEFGGRGGVWGEGEAGGGVSYGQGGEGRGGGVLFVYVQAGVFVCAFVVAGEGCL